MKTLPDSSPKIIPADRPIDPKALLATLRARFPVLANFRPLKIKIHLDIRAALAGEGIANVRIAHALALQTGDSRYLQALAKGGHRFNLVGEMDGEVTEEQRRHATEQLKARRQNKKPNKPMPPPAPVEPPTPEPPPAQAAAVPPLRPILKLKPKAGPIAAASVTRKERQL